MKSKSQARKAVPESERARCVAWLLCLDPYEVFPFGPEHTKEANQYLVEYVIDQLELLDDEADRYKSKPGQKSPRFIWYLWTLKYCFAVMEGRAEPLPTNEIGEFINNGDLHGNLRRGRYRPEGGGV